MISDRSEGDFPDLTVGLPVINRGYPDIFKDSFCIFEIDAVFLNIGLIFLIIPFKLHFKKNTIVCTICQYIFSEFPLSFPMIPFVDSMLSGD